MDYWNIFFQIGLPLAVFVLTVYGIINLKKHIFHDVRVNSGIFSTPIKIINLKLAKIIYTFFLTLFYAMYLLFVVDASSFFPTKFNLIVDFNDQYRVNKLLDEMELTELNGLPIVRQSDSTIAAYFKKGDKEIEELLTYENFYSDVVFNNKSEVETKGEATFIVKKIGGIHNYMITEAKGSLQHIKLNEVNKRTEQWTSEFNKVTSSNDRISISSPLEIFDNIIFAPKFNQRIITSAQRETKIEQTLYGVSYIHFFPVPDFSDTVYLVKHNNKLIPIGIATNYIP